MKYRILVLIDDEWRLVEGEEGIIIDSEEADPLEILTTAIECIGLNKEFDNEIIMGIKVKEYDD